MEGLIYPDYEYYTQHGGTLSQAEYNLLLNKAIYIMDNATFGRYSKLRTDNTPLVVVTRLKDCIVDIVNYLNTVLDNGVISYKQEVSERVGNWQVSYSSTGINPNMMVYVRQNIVGLYLDTTDLTCRWI